MVYCPVVVVGRDSDSGNVARCRSPNLCLPQQQDSIPYAVNLSLTLLKMSKNCPKHVELILEINKLLLHLVGFSILLYLH